MGVGLGFCPVTRLTNRKHEMGPAYLAVPPNNGVINAPFRRGIVIDRYVSVVFGTACAVVRWKASSINDAPYDGFATR